MRLSSYFISHKNGVDSTALICLHSVISYVQTVPFKPARPELPQAPLLRRRSLPGAQSCFVSFRVTKIVIPPLIYERRVEANRLRASTFGSFPC